MFCSNCGFKVSENDNYCPNCGKKLKNIKVSIINEEVEQAKNISATKVQTTLKDETRIFKPIQIDNIDSTNNIKDIIKEVDKTISKNIENYEKNITDDFIGPQEPINKDINIKEISKDKKIIQKSKTIETPKEKNKKSLMDKFKNFINEDDDEFSIFSSLNKNKEIDEGVEIASASDNTQTNFEDTMGISKAEIEDAIIKSEQQQRDKTSKIPKENLSNNVVKENKNNEEKKKSLNYKSFTDLVNEELNKSSKNKENDKNIKDKKENLKEIKEPIKNTKDSVKNFFKKEKEKVSKKVTEIKKEEKNIRENKYTKVKNETVNKKVIEKIEKEILDDKPAIYKHLLKLNLKFTSLENKIFKSKHSFKIILAIGILISILPIFISLKEVSLTLLLLGSLKIIFRFFEFYLPLNITINKIWVSTNKEEIKKYSLLNFVICDSVLLICYILSPMYGFFNFYLLGALTSLPIGTIILVLLSTTIATSFYLKEIREDNNLLDFVAWYMISFIVIEFISKFIFIFANFLING